MLGTQDVGQGNRLPVLWLALDDGDGQELLLLRESLGGLSHVPLDWPREGAFRTEHEPLVGALGRIHLDRLARMLAGG